MKRTKSKKAKPHLVISFSGGRTSAFMTKWVLDNWKDLYEKIIVVFANTGKEREETLEFTQQCDEYFNFNCVWVEAVTNPQYGKGVSAKVVNYKTASRKGEPFIAMVAKHGMPSVNSPICTRELKTNAIKAYLRSIGWKNYYIAIGIRVDEIDRVSPNAKKQKLIYPLVSNIPTTKQDINKFWGQQPFDLRLKPYEGNCDLCFKKSLRKLMTIVKQNPDLVDWWGELEKQYSEFIPISKRNNEKLKPPLYCFRSNKSIFDIVEMAKHPFSPARDDSKYIPSLFDMDLDTSNGCSESCEVF